MNLSVCLVTTYNSQYADIAALTIPHMKDYADRHSYEFRVVLRGECDRGGGWLKIEPIRDALSSGFDLVLWLDVDALIVRKGMDIRDAAHPGADLHMAWLHPDPSRFTDPPHYNAGVMLIRSTDWARGFFARVWDVGPLPHHWRDQAAILHLLGFDDILNLGSRRYPNSDCERTARLDTAWNSILGVDVAADPIIHHYAGVDCSTRLKWLKVDERSIELRAQATDEMRRAFVSLLNEGLSVDRDRTMAIDRQSTLLNAANSQIAELEAKIQAITTSVPWRIIRAASAATRRLALGGRSS